MSQDHLFPVPLSSPEPLEYEQDDDQERHDGEQDGEEVPVYVAAFVIVSHSPPFSAEAYA